LLPSPDFRTAARAPLRLIAAAFALAAAPALADPKCPAPAAEPAAAAALPAPNDEHVHLTSAGADLPVTEGGRATLQGPVEIRQRDRTLTAREATYDTGTQAIDASGNVEYRDSKVKVSGDSATWRPDGGGSFGNADFELPQRQARGHAGRIAVAADGRLELDHVDYTACPAGQRDWVLHARQIDIDQKAQEGDGRGVRLDFMGVPIVYLPYVSFPVGDARKSGFLFPAPGDSSRNGFEITAPYYWNMAPNHDATLTPGFMSKRGGTLGTEFRFLTDQSRGEFQDDWVPYDHSAGRDRDLLKIVERTDFNPHLRFDTNVNYASDRAYFSDFGQGPEATSVTFLTRIARLTYLDSHWKVVGLAEQYQTIDQAVIAGDRPYTRAPQILLGGNWTDGSGPGFEVHAEAVNFTRDAGPRGGRYDVEPTASWTYRAPGLFLIPAVGWHATQYALRDDPGAATSASVAAPIATFDSGLTFERSNGQTLQTLEPRALYTYIPYRDQTALPLFDTGLPDLNLVQLFRSERYVGGDRIGDANQLALGATTRFVDLASGRQLLAATLGQIYYFRPPRVRLPTETATSPSTSDLVTQLDISAYRHWNVMLGEQWDPHAKRADLSELMLQYKPAWDKVANFSYRYRHGLLEQLDGSLAWPIRGAWNIYARHVYSLRDHAPIESLGGFEYQACCWRVRLVARRYVNAFTLTTGTRTYDTGVSLQLELNGLSSVGERADAFLERSIRGYSATPSSSVPE
jgi:LPS-assembly protein